MAKIPKKIKNQIKRITNKTDDLADELDENIDKYQKAYERELLKMSFDEINGEFKKTTKNYNKINSLKMSKRLKWDAIVSDFIERYNDLPLFNLEYHESVGIDIDNVDYRDLTIVKQFKTQDYEGLLTEGITLDNLVRKELVNAVALGSPIKLSIDNLAKNLLGSSDKLGRLSRYSQTYIKTSVMGLSRMIDKEVYDKLNLADEYLYAGTIDHRIRDFCRHRVGKTFTNEQIKKFPQQNGSGLNPWFSVGGWNCRHRLISTDLI